MDIIAAHQQGLIEQLEEDVRALTGRSRSHGQRAVVLHHLFDHSRGAHAWALAEARREMRIARAIVALDKRIDRWGWAIPRREVAEVAWKNLVEAIGEASRARCAATYRAYRLTAAAALLGEAERSLPAALIEALEHCHRARRSGEPFGEMMQRRLWEASEQLAASATDQAQLDAAWSAIEATGLKRAVRQLLGDRVLERETARDGKRGWVYVERELRNDPLLPKSFRANPAQHFYALQHALAERRRQQWREACDRDTDSFELAA